MRLWKNPKAIKIGDFVLYSNGQNHIDHQVLPDGSYNHICSSCLTWKHESELYEDAHGQRWDFCIECATREERDKYGFL